MRRAGVIVYPVPGRGSPLLGDAIKGARLAEVEAVPAGRPIAHLLAADGPLVAVVAGAGDATPLQAGSLGDRQLTTPRGRRHFPPRAGTVPADAEAAGLAGGDVCPSDGVCVLVRVVFSVWVAGDGWTTICRVTRDGGIASRCEATPGRSTMPVPGCMGTGGTEGQPQDSGDVLRLRLPLVRGGSWTRGARGVVAWPCQLF